MNYRPEIDGLRAIAVLPVILFHAHVNLFQGGFVGVDIFFVISGYLITTIILTNIYNSSFSISDFYERRARRLLPALFTVLLFTTIFSVLLLPPIELRDFGQSLFFVSFFISNFFFWIESGYFDGGIDFKPLIHTWSLGVEEQFYILFPLAGIFLAFFNKRLILPFILLIFIFSLSLAIIYSAEENSLDTREAAFFLLPARGWELMLGSLIFFIKKQFQINKNNMLNNAFSMMGFFMIVYSIIFFSEDTPFPSQYTLIPTLGAVFLILFATKGTILYALLTAKVMVAIGLISYSAYLWHQPLLVFSRYLFPGEMNMAFILGLLFLTLSLAYFSWRFIEQPFRSKDKFTKKNIFVSSLIGCLVFGAIGGAMHISDGFEFRYNKKQLELLKFIKYEERDILYRNRDCFLRNDQTHEDFSQFCEQGQALVWGDSHAAGMSYGIRYYLKTSQLTASGCPPIINLHLNNRPNCLAINSYVLDFIKRVKPSNVFLHANWISNFYPDYEERLDESLRLLSNDFPEINFFILGGLPQWRPTLPNVMLIEDQMLDSKDLYLFNNLYSKVKEKDKRIINIIEEIDSKNVNFISLVDLMCKDQNCISKSTYPTTEPISFDYGHLTGSGSILVSSLILQAMDENNNQL